jgi:hypothetical protein
MGNACATAGKARNAIVIKFNTMGVPHIVSGPTQVLGVLGGCATKLLEAISHVIIVFCQMRMQGNTELTRQNGTLPHQILRHRKWRTRRQHNTAHAAFRCIMIGLGQALHIFENAALIFHH